MHRPCFRLRAAGALICAFALLCTAHARATDIYDQAVAHAGRSERDLRRDAIDRPAEVLRLAAIRPGMQVADIMAGDGYYSELSSYIVGPHGHVVLFNNPIYDKWSPGLADRIAHDRLTNVEHRTADLAHMGLAPASLDAVLLIKVYHDLYWTDSSGEWPKADPAAVLDQLARALKPNGILLLVDHSAKPGSGSSPASQLHRIDESFARHDFESHGFVLVARGDFLRRPDDARDQITYKGPMVGKTDRFVLVFHKRS
jgi:predicted methyltransferase